MADIVSLLVQLERANTGLYSFKNSISICVIPIVFMTFQCKKNYNFSAYIVKLGLSRAYLKKTTYFYLVLSWKPIMSIYDKTFGSCRDLNKILVQEIISEVLNCQLQAVINSYRVRAVQKIMVFILHV